MKHYLEALKQITIYLKQGKKGTRLYDREDAHMDADDILCNMLIELGYIDIVEEYKSIPKWYA